ncbi:MAG: diacylglycerol kinase family lipid kinase [Deltaproteobacteria bacterium]|jgi:YegS/Rv2252/BmrU family lipid kinase|nr:diacylglycerol kinase family lipid kinase [Deltaproteobacteria bacterium]MBW2533510.1 diacylglycerol kinase family lipid kinase [Deltaproteobacteria bacterium]
MTALLILNPKSGGGRTGRHAAELERRVRARLGSVDVVRTERPRHAAKLAEEAAIAGRETVLSAGGDGTIHEIVNGLMVARERDAAATRLGIIGRGTGGDFRRTLGLEHELDAYLSAVEEGKTRTIDVGRLRYVDHDGRDGTGYFVNILSMGMGGLVDQYVATTARRLPGVAAYFTATVVALVRSRIGHLRCRVRNGDEEREVRLSSRNLAICNGRFFGSGMEVAPMAEPDDGLFHIVSLPARGRLHFALFSRSIYAGTHVDAPDVEVLSCNGIHIELDNPGVSDRFLLDVDGEPLGKLPIDVELLPRALEVFVP